MEDRGACAQCSGSYLWEYVLVTTIFACMRGSRKDDEHTVVLRAQCECMCIFFLEGGLAIWGYIELYQNSCPRLKETSLRTVGQVTFGLQVMAVSVYIFAICAAGVATKRDNNANLGNV